MALKSGYMPTFIAKHDLVEISLEVNLAEHSTAI